MASSWLQSFLLPKRNWFAAQHKKAICNRLCKYGLRYDDLYDPMYDLDIREALNRLPREIVDARNQRLKRAMDLSMKHEYLPEDLQMVGMKRPYPVCLFFSIRPGPSSIANFLLSLLPSADQMNQHHVAMEGHSILNPATQFTDLPDICKGD